MSGPDNSMTPGAARTIGNLLHPGAGQRRSASDQFVELLASSGSFVALVMLHAIGLVLWIAASLGLMPGVPVPNSDHIQLLAVLLSFEAVLLCTLVLARQGRMNRLADERGRLSLQATLLLEAGVTEVLQQLDRTNARLDIAQQGTGRGQHNRGPR